MKMLYKSRFGLKILSKDGFDLMKKINNMQILTVRS